VTQKNTLFFVNFYLFIGNFEVFPKKSAFWRYLFIGLKYCFSFTGDTKKTLYFL